ncbi:hypothetical protein Tco_0764068 [Tanacetum coccineum]
MVAYLLKPEGSEDFHQIVDFLNTSHIKYALTENPTIHVSLIQQFWQTISASTSEDGEMEITANIDGRVKTVTEASIRRHIKLEDSDGISTLPNTEIFEQLALMGYVSNSNKLTFQKGHFSPQWRFLIHTILHCLSPKKTSWEQFSSNIATAIICLATNRTFNFSKMIFEGMVKILDSKSKFLMYPRFIQIFLNKHKRLLLPHNRTYIAPTLTHKLFSNMRRASKGYTRVDIPLFPTMLVQGPNLQGQGSTVQSDSHHTTTSAPSTSQPPTSPPSMQTTHVAEEAATLPYDSPLPRVHSLGSDEGSMTLHELIVLCTTLSKKVESLESDLKQTKLTYGAAFTKLIMKVKRLEKEVKLNKARRRAKIVVSDDEDAEKDTSKQERSMIEDIDQDVGVSLVQINAKDQGSAAKILADVARVHTYSRRRRTVSTGSGGISTADVSMPVSTAGIDQGSIPSPSISKDKGKAIMIEFKPEQATAKLKQRQEIASYEATIRLQEYLNEDESQRIARDAEGFTDAEWDDILARVAADEDLVQQLQAGEKYSEEDLPMKLMELVNQRKKFFAQQRTKAERNKLYMSTYIKHQEGGYSIKQLKLLSFEQVKEIFEATMRRVQSFVPMDSQLEVQRLKRAGQEVSKKHVKRQKIGEASGSGEEHSAEKEKEVSQEDLQQLVMIVPVEEVYVEALRKFDRDDLDKLWSLVKERSSSIDPTDDKERILWVELKRLFKPDVDDILWKLQRYIHDPLTWRLYDTCGVHHVSTDKGNYIFMLVEKDYPLTNGLMTVMLANKLQVDQSSEMANELLRKIFIQAERPRQ